MKETLRVLFIEDSTEDVALTVMAMGKIYKLVWQRVEKEAPLILALDDEWDVILCDYKMPALTVERALDTVRTHPFSKDVPFIIISGSVKEDVVIDLLKKGANDFIEKDPHNNVGRLVFAIQREVLSARQKAAEEQRMEIRIDESYEATIEAWGVALELRDKYSEGHTVRVADLALRLALQMKISHNEFVDLNRGALLHDIGKMGIPDSILLKPTELTLEEMEIMKLHPTYARDMLAKIPFLKDATTVPYCHHERWNGTGYPNGLKNHNIPFLARLFMVVDVWDALITDRPYRPAWTPQRALEYIRAERNITFDPDVVDAFVDLIEKGV